MKPITLTEADKTALLAKFAAQLNQARGCEKISFTIKPELPKTVGKQVRLDFNALAWFKMRSLVEHCTTECAWHGTITPSEDRKLFTVTDILVYPQIIASATVEQDDKDNAYEIWHQGLNTPTYNSLRLQGHSHVNMAAHPSGVDTTMYDEMLQALRADSYYIFMITNKTGNVWVNIYDLLNNVIYENDDVMITVEGIDSYAWFKDAKDVYMSSPVAPATTKSYPDFYAPDPDAFFSAGDGPADRLAGIYDITGRNYGKNTKTTKRR